MQLPHTGAIRYRQVLGGPELDRIAGLFGKADRPGERMSAHSLAPVADLISFSGAIGAIAAWALGPEARPVRTLLFDKRPEVNWRLGWHQDRTICVAERRDVPGFGPWTVKAGLIHVQPPTDLLERMVTVRVHVDPVDEGNAPLEVIPGSHLRGRLTEPQVDALAAASERLMCLAEAGDVWLYSTLIVHASAEQKIPGRRRVLQLDYSADQLPGALRWVDLLTA